MARAITATSDGGGEADGEQVDAGDGAVDQEAEADRAERQRHRDHAHALLGRAQDAAGGGCQAAAAIMATPTHQPASNQPPDS